MPPSSSRVRLSAAHACRLYGCAPAELRRRVRSGELVGGRDPRSGDVVVELDVDEAELPAQAVARLLGIATPSVRAAIRAGRLAGRRDAAGWRVPLRAVLDDPRFPSELRRELEREGFAAIIEHEQEREPARASLLTRPLYVRLVEAEAEALERLRFRHANLSRAVGAALVAESRRAQVSDDREQLTDELAETRAALKRARRETEQARAASAGFPSELYCPGCSSFVPLDELEQEREYRDEPGEVWLHRHGGLRSIVAPETVVARRRR